VTEEGKALGSPTTRERRNTNGRLRARVKGNALGFLSRIVGRRATGAAAFMIILAPRRSGRTCNTAGSKVHRRCRSNESPGGQDALRLTSTSHQERHKLTWNLIGQRLSVSNGLASPKDAVPSTKYDGPVNYSCFCGGPNDETASHCSPRVAPTLPDRLLSSSSAAARRSAWWTLTHDLSCNARLRIRWSKTVLHGTRIHVSATRQDDKEIDI
jgi:hypothetical protein